MTTWKCGICDVSFERRGGRTYQFCSIACRSAANRIKRPSHGELREMYVEQEMTANDIARIVGCDPKTAWAWIRAAGIQTRPRGSYAAQQFKPGQRSAHAGHKHSQETKDRLREFALTTGKVPYLRNGVHHLKGVTGPDHPTWKGGITRERQAFSNSPEWKQAARAVRIRDGFMCRRCGVRPPSGGPKHRRGHVHHIVSFQVPELRTELGNLVLLCVDCHHWVHSRANTSREYLA